MKRARLALACLAVVAGGAAVAQSTGGAYAIERHLVAGGGGTSSGGTYALSGTIGQAAAHADSNGGTYALAGGFWIAEEAPPASDPLFANGFE